MTAVAPGVFYRHLSLAEVQQRQRSRPEQEVSRHNAGVVAALGLGPQPSRHDQVLELFDPQTRRWAR